MKLNELTEGAKLQKQQTEFHGFKFYVEDAYGHGLDPSSIDIGEMLSDEDGNDAEYLGITPDGKKVIVKMKGKKKEVDPEFVNGKIFPADKKPGGPGWAKASIGDHYRNK